MSGSARTREAVVPADHDVSVSHGVRLGITLGDPRGIGPEVSVRAAEIVASAEFELLFIGPRGTEADRGPVTLDAIGDWAGGDEATAGRLAARAIERGVRLARDGAIEALVTAPIHKAALRAAGYRFPGHTEMLAELAGIEDVGMMMCAEETHLGGSLRVLLATTHLPLREVARTLTTDRLLRQTRLAAAALRRDWGIDAPRLALCAFNPHASDGGLFGTEEATIYEPVLRRLIAEGITAFGPVPADTVFIRALRGEFDAVVAPYHDVGMAAFKTAAFGRGVNVTIGLPFVRTSPDHGTALDIAGHGRADPASMVEAIRLAARLGARRGRDAATVR